MYRTVEVSAADAGWRLITAAREMIDEPMERFGKYNR